MPDIPQHSLYAMGCVLALLFIATGIYLGIRSANRKKDYTELGLRIKSWWWMCLIVFGVLIVSPSITILFFAFVSFLALKEFFSIIPTRLSDRRVIFWVYVSIPIQYWWVYTQWYGMFIIFIPVYMFLLLPMRMVLIGETKGFIHAAGILQWAMMLTVFCISHIAFLVTLPVQELEEGSIGLILFLLIMTELNDVCQYIWGKSFGKHKITPKVSPNKTWEGFVGGVISTTIIGGFLAPYLTPLSFKLGIVISFIIAVSGFFGDLVVSSAKRDLNIKDSGMAIPGHGGILDRLDSLLYTAPCFSTSSGITRSKLWIDF